MLTEKDVSEKSFIEHTYYNITQLLTTVFGITLSANDEEQLSRICIEMHKDYWKDFGELKKKVKRK